MYKLYKTEKIKPFFEVYPGKIFKCICKDEPHHIEYMYIEYVDEYGIFYTIISEDPLLNGGLCSTYDAFNAMVNSSTGQIEEINEKETQQIKLELL